MADNSKPRPEDPRNETILFAQLIELLTQNAVLMLGALPDRQGRQRPPDLAGAEMMIEILGVLRKRTKGNLTKDEDRMLSRTLYELQSAFTEVASKSGEFEKARKVAAAAETTEEQEHEEPGEEVMEHAADPPTGNSGAPPSPPSAEGIQAAPSAASESKIKFTKKYGS